MNRLARAGLIMADRTVEDAIFGKPRGLSTRTEQRRVLQITGLTRGAIYQIERARRATLLLRRGPPHPGGGQRGRLLRPGSSTRSLQRFIGLSPARIAGGKEQLSLLYNK